MPFDGPIAFDDVLTVYSRIESFFEKNNQPLASSVEPRSLAEIIRLIGIYRNLEINVFEMGFYETDGIFDDKRSTTMASISMLFAGEKRNRLEVYLNSDEIPHETNFMNKCWKRFLTLKEVCSPIVKDFFDALPSELSSSAPVRNGTAFKDLVHFEFSKSGFEQSKFSMDAKLDQACEMVTFFLLYPYENFEHDLAYLSDNLDQELAVFQLANKYQIPQRYLSLFLHSDELDSIYRFIANAITNPEAVHSDYASIMLLNDLQNIGGQTPKEIRSSELQLSEPKGEYQVWFGTDRKAVITGGDLVGFLSERGDCIRLGKCMVNIPKSHAIGSLGSSWLKRLFKGDDRLELLSTLEFDRGEFWQGLSNALQLDASGRKIGIVYVHGFNTSFEQAILRAAQIGFDIGIQSCMATFSWPSSGWYTLDEASIEASEVNFASFISDFVSQTGVEKIHIIAHSMGNRLLMRSLNYLRQSRGAQHTAEVLGQAILAAPDVHQDTFRQFASSFKHLAEQTTIYTSNKDRAIEASEFLHLAPRVGFFPPIFVHSSLDTICVSDIDLSRLGHSYYADSRPVLSDIHRIVMTCDSPSLRMGLRSLNLPSGETYWNLAR